MRTCRIQILLLLISCSIIDGELSVENSVTSMNCKSSYMKQELDALRQLLNQETLIRMSQENTLKDLKKEVEEWKKKNDCVIEAINPDSKSNNCTMSAELYAQSLYNETNERLDVGLADVLEKLRTLETKLNLYREENAELKAELKKLLIWRNKTEASVCSVDHEWEPFHGHTYKYYKTKMNWTDAKIVCEKEGGYLVEIEDRLESDWIKNKFLTKDACSTYDVTCMVWTGGTDTGKEGVFRWSHSNKTFHFTNWNPQQPSKAVPKYAAFEDCVNLLPAGDWNDAPCGMNFDFLCEKSIHSQLCLNIK